MRQTHKIVLIVLMAAITIIGIFISIFYWQNLRGIWPAIQKPKADIAEILNDNFGKEMPMQGENKTNFPLLLPDNFTISIFAKNLNNPRVMSYDPAGNMLVSIPEDGKVVALVDENYDGTADKNINVAAGLHDPHGLAWRCNPNCQLYIAESDQVAVYDYDTQTLKAGNKKKLVDLPDDGGHFTRTLMFMPSPNEDTLLISVGSSCNVCREKDARRAKILALDINTNKLADFATGLRNSVFMAIHPVTGQIWATEMGRDLLGDNTPPDEINIIKEGGNYGWPICYGKNIHDTSFDKNIYIRNPCEDTIPSYIDIQAHSAPLGLAFIPEEGWPQEYWHNLLVAYHGSWNRTEPTGYKIVRYKLDENGKYLGQEDFISGWLQDGDSLGRPVDILIQPGGTIYISDDRAGVIYKLKYKQPKISKNDLIRVSSPLPNQEIKNSILIEGEARGTWFFEASFPIILIDEAGNELASHYAEATSDWMTENFVPFRAELKFKTPKTTTGYLILKKDNPSGLPENDDSLAIPVKFATQ